MRWYSSSFNPCCLTNSGVTSGWVKTSDTIDPFLTERANIDPAGSGVNRESDCRYCTFVAVLQALRQGHVLRAGDEKVVYQHGDIGYSNVIFNRRDTARLVNIGFIQAVKCFPAYIQVVDQK